MLKDTLKKLAKWSTIGGLVGAAYGFGRMNPPRKTGRFEKMLRKGRK
jgi:hypothetical protein